MSSGISAHDTASHQTYAFPCWIKKPVNRVISLFQNIESERTKEVLKRIALMTPSLLGAIQTPIAAACGVAAHAVMKEPMMNVYDRFEYLFNKAHPGVQGLGCIGAISALFVAQQFPVGRFFAGFLSGFLLVIQSEKCLKALTQTIEPVIIDQ